MQYSHKEMGAFIPGIIDFNLALYHSSKTTVNSSKTTVVKQQGSTFDVLSIAIVKYSIFYQFYVC